MSDGNSGVQLEEGAAVTIQSGWVLDNNNFGVLAQAGSQVTLDGATISNSTFAGLTFSDGIANVSNTSISNSGTGILAEDAGALTVTGGTIASNTSTYGIFLRTGASGTVQNGTIIDNNGVGLGLTGASNLTIDGCTISNSVARNGIELWDGSTAAVTNCAFIGNADPPNQKYSIQLFRNAVDRPAGALTALSGNTFEPNGLIAVGGELALTNNRLFSDGVPLVSYRSLGSIIVREGRTLTIDPGVTLQFDFGGLSVLGTLTADNATFTALNPPPSGNFWRAIFFWPGSTGNLADCTVEYGGSIAREFHPDHPGDASDPSFFLDALGSVVVANSAVVTLQNTTTRNSNRAGVWSRGSAPLLQTVIARDNAGHGLHAIAGSAPQADPAGKRDAGIGYFFHGGVRLSGTIDLADPFAPVDLLIYGLPKDKIGMSTVVGNFGGDNVTDLLIGAPVFTGSTGEAYLLLGGPKFGGALAKRVASTQAVEGELQLPTQFALEQNYPNPFNPETEIRFQLPVASQVVVRVFNIPGEEVRKLAHGPYEAGFHTLHWNGKNHQGNPVSSGTYLYQIQAGDFAQVKMMSLLR